MERSSCNFLFSPAYLEHGLSLFISTPRDVTYEGGGTWNVLHVIFSFHTGYPEHGLSLFISTPRDVTYEGGGTWNVLHGWTFQSTDGHFQSSTYFSIG